MPDTLILYTRKECHLCQEALGIAQSVGAQLEAVDITANDGLFERYCVTIPVIRNDRQGREISWPFGPDDVLDLMGPDAT